MHLLRTFLQMNATSYLRKFLFLPSQLLALNSYTDTYFTLAIIPSAIFFINMSLKYMKKK